MRSHLDTPHFTDGDGGHLYDGSGAQLKPPLQTLCGFSDVWSLFLDPCVTDADGWLYGRNFSDLRTATCERRRKLGGAYSPKSSPIPLDGLVCRTRIWCRVSCGSHHLCSKELLRELFTLSTVPLVCLHTSHSHPPSLDYVTCRRPVLLDGCEGASQGYGIPAQHYLGHTAGRRLLNSWGG